MIKNWILLKSDGRLSRKGSGVSETNGNFPSVGNLYSMSVLDEMKASMNVCKHKKFYAKIENLRILLRE